MLVVPLSELSARVLSSPISLYRIPMALRIFLEPWGKNEGNGWSSSAKKAMFYPASLSQKGLLAPIIRRDDLTWTEQELTKTGVEKGLTKHDGNVARRYTKNIKGGHIPDGW